jgi:hypothetical protein
VRNVKLGNCETASMKTNNDSTCFNRKPVVLSQEFHEAVGCLTKGFPKQLVLTTFAYFDVQFPAVFGNPFIWQLVNKNIFAIALLDLYFW